MCELDKLSAVYSPRYDMLHLVDGLTEHELQFLEDAICIRRNQIACERLSKYNVECEYCTFNDGCEEVYNYYRYVTIVDRGKKIVKRIYPMQDQLPRLFNMLANLDKKEAIKRWLEREDFEEWQVQRFDKEHYEEWYG